jgi:hypothetical protein
LVLIVSADGKSRYEEMVGRSADLPATNKTRRGVPAGQEGEIECATPGQVRGLAISATT